MSFLKFTSKYVVLPYRSPDEEGKVYKTRDKEGDLVLSCVDGVDDADQHVDCASEDPEDGDEDSLGLEDPGQPEAQAGEQEQDELQLGVVGDAQEPAHHLVHLEDESSARASKMLPEEVHQGHEEEEEPQGNTEASKHIVLSEGGQHVVYLTLSQSL